MIVFDSSALAKYVLREEGWEALEEFMARIPLTLDQALKEVGNALWKRCGRGEVEVDYAARVLGELVKSSFIEVVDEREVLVDALRIAAKEGITVYDALFIALASVKGGKLITCDERQYEAAKRLRVEALLVR